MPGPRRRSRYRVRWCRMWRECRYPSRSGQCGMRKSLRSVPCKRSGHCRGCRSGGGRMFSLDLYRGAILTSGVHVWVVCRDLLQTRTMRVAIMLGRLLYIYHTAHTVDYSIFNHIAKHHINKDPLPLRKQHTFFSFFKRISFLLSVINPSLILYIPPFSFFSFSFHFLILTPQPLFLISHFLFPIPSPAPSPSIHPTLSEQTHHQQRAASDRIFRRESTVFRRENTAR